VDLLDALRDNTTAERALAAERLELIAELSARNVPAEHGYTSLTPWLRAVLRMTINRAAETGTLAHRLPQLPALAKALADADVSEAQAVVIAEAVAEFTGSVQTDAAQALIEQAAILTPEELRIAGRRILDHVDPEAADEHDRKAMQREAKRAMARRGFTLTPDGHGSVRISGHTDAEGAAIIASALDPLCNPARRTLQDIAAGATGAGPDAAIAAAASATTTGLTPGAVAAGAVAAAAPGERADSADAAGAGAACVGTAGAGAAGEGAAADSMAAGAFAVGVTTAAAVGAGTGGAGVDEPLPLPLQDNRTAAQRRHDALIEVFQRTLAAGELPDNGGDKAQLAVTVTYDPLRQAISAATLDTGARISPEAVRRIACDCGVIPAVLDGAGVPLDVGRERRLITGTLRRALVLRDHGCAFPGCDRPPRWCQGHHVIHWLDGGTTSLQNSVLLCAHHHRLIHQGDWTVDIAADGLPEFIPPAHLDPSQTPRRNTYHRRT
jgi:hypothetical protein